MKQHSKLSSQQQHNTQGQQSAREFASAEELLRHDAASTKVPPGIAQRLSRSAADIPRPNKSWWRRLFDA